MSKAKRKSKEEVGAERLLKLGIYLRDVVAKKYRKHFYMGQWAVFFTPKEAPGCGTTACALGWATNIFSELTIESLESRSFKLGLYVSYRRRVGVPLDGINAAEEFFHITHKEAQNLFLPHRGHTRVGDVALNIIRFAKAKLKEAGSCSDK